MLSPSLLLSAPTSLSPRSAPWSWPPPPLLLLLLLLPPLLLLLLLLRGGKDHHVRYTPSASCAAFQLTSKGVAVLS